MFFLVIDYEKVISVTSDGQLVHTFKSVFLIILWSH